MACGSVDPDVGNQRCGGTGAAATSALLAVLGAVNQFGKALLSPLGAPAGNLGYVEFQVKDDCGNLSPVVRLTMEFFTQG